MINPFRRLFANSMNRQYALGLRSILCVAAGLLILLEALPAAAADLKERLTPEVMAIVFPNAGKLGNEEGKPPAIPVYQGDQITGYIFSTLDIVAAPGYSSVPFDVIAGVDLTGRVTGAKVIFHREPYIMNDTRRQGLLDTFLQRHNGMALQGGNSGVLPPDYVQSATVSARAMRGAIFDSARLVLRSRGGRPKVNVPTLDLESFQIATWEQLLEKGAVVKRRFTSGDVGQALDKAGARGGKLEDDLGKPDELYSEILTGYFSPASVGRNMIGSRPFDEYMQRQTKGSHVFVIASNGPYDFLGSDYNRAAKGNKFDRIRIVQENNSFEFVRSQFQRLGTGGPQTGIRGNRYAALYALAPEAKFDPLKPWRLELLVHSEMPDGRKTIALPVDYKIPADYVMMPEAEPVPAWVDAWNDARTNVYILGVTLIVLTLILIFQAPLTRMTKTYRWIRHSFLLFVLVWVGWYAGAQLSIVNVINYMMAPFHNFGWGFYLAEPLMVMIAIYTLISLILLGRGVFCGWLCPFGALQELLGQASRALGLPQWNPSEKLQRKLWLGKYISAAVVLGVAVFSLDMAVTAAEVEPFKTAITSHFTRAWPYLIYASALVGIGLFTERAYCRFLCPLGGVLALLDRLHLIDLLKRRPECGNPCHLCERSCPVRAIESSGKIVMAECFQCLDCQVEYYDDKRCPPLVKDRKRNDPTRSFKPRSAPVTARVQINTSRGGAK